MGKLTEDDLYDMTREFLVETVVPRAKRPQAVLHALRSLDEMAPEAAAIVESYIRQLEGDDK